MRNLLLWPAIVVAVLAVGAQPSFAQEGGAAVVTLGEGWSGPGFYLSLLKFAACWLLFLLWVHTTDWLSTDAQEFKLEYRRWNPVVFGTFLGAFVLVWLIPMFAVGYPLLCVAYLAPLTAYIVHRNRQVSSSERVLTADHIRHWMAGKASTFGVKIDVEDKDPHETGPPVILTARGAATNRDDNVNLLSARQSPGFRDARQLIADGLFRRCDSIVLDYTQQAASVRHLIDGVWHADEPWERDVADPLLVALKTLAGLKSDDRQSRQEGKFVTEYQSLKFETTMICQGTKAGERVVIKFLGEKTQFEGIDDLGMRPKMREQVLEILGSQKGFMIFAAMPGTGLRSTTNVILRTSDRFTREFMTVEEVSNRYEEVENIGLVSYDKAGGKTLLDVLPDFFLQEPGVVVLRDLDGGETVDLLCREVDNDRLIITTVRAKDSVDALLRVLALGGSPRSFARKITAVLSQRLIRKLCDECKVAYAPTPKVLQQLGIPEGRVQAFHRPPQEGEREQACLECGGLGYLGRTAIFELLVVDDAARKVLATSPDADTLRQAARKAGMQSLQQEGIVLVAKGVTSLPELMRVLKQ
jgi:type II secretory ATPase GspE/PulE/Tfp pilus assembly ATPase PilB-like protein